MDTKESWISPEGYLLNISQFNEDIISGNLRIDLNDDYWVIPFEGLVSIDNGHPYEFLFIVDWNSYIINANCYTTFAAKKYAEKNIEYISLEWLLVDENNGRKTQNLPIKGRHKFTKAPGETPDQILADKPNNPPHPFFVELVNAKGNKEKYEN